jgi:hypothetical protein
MMVMIVVVMVISDEDCAYHDDVIEEDVNACLCEGEDGANDDEHGDMSDVSDDKDVDDD